MNQSADKKPVEYMARTRQYYEAQGFDKAYAWASYDEVPFTPLPRPLSDLRLGLVTTAALYNRDGNDPRNVASGSMQDPPERLYGNDLSWDKKATHMDDRESYAPFVQLQQAVTDGLIGALSPRFYCAPTEYSQRRTTHADSATILDLCREDNVDIALLVPL